MATLQKQGVPIPSKLNGPQPRNVSAPNGPNTRTATPNRTSRGSTPRRSAGTASQSVGNRKSGSSARPGSISASSVPNPVSAGNNATSGVGLLEAEFLTAFGILILLMFASDDQSLTDKMMMVMKRGTLICAVFFVLALISGIGPKASKSAKAFGALIIVAILVTSPIGTVLTDVDNIIKNDWIGQTPSAPASGTNASGSADAGTASASSGTSILSEVEKAAGFFGDVENTPYKTAQTVLGLIGIKI